ncbi:MAG: hypothetical protein HN348_31865, partial [Proteobacteria bacterium]|nr:hypothetical protein [Pseudomonadota bacterium]
TAPQRQNEDDLLCVITESVDADGDNVAYEVTWEVDGVPFGQATTTEWVGDTVPLDDTMTGLEWACTVVADDGEESSEEVTDTILLEHCACDLTDATEAMLNIDYWTARDLFDTCLECDPNDSSALFGSALMDTFLLGESSSMVDVYSWCDETPDFPSELFGDGGLMTTYTEMAEGEAKLAVQHVGPSTFNVDFPQDPLIVAAQVSHDELELIIADTLLQNSVLEISLPINDVYGNDTLNLGDGAVVDIATQGFGGDVFFELDCDITGSTCKKWYDNPTYEGTITFNEFSSVEGQPIEVELDLSLGADCDYEQCDVYYHITTTEPIVDVISETLEMPDVPFMDFGEMFEDCEDEGPGCFFFEVFEERCDPGGFGAVNELASAFAVDLRENANKLAAAGADADLSFRLPMDRAIISGSDLYFNQTDALFAASAMRLWALALITPAQYNYIDPLVGPDELFAPYMGNEWVCGNTCTCEVVELDGPNPDDYLDDFGDFFLAPSSVWNFDLVEDDLLTATELLIEAIDANP